MRTRPRSTSKQAPRLYLVPAAVTRQRYLDCDDGACGVCDHCVHMHAAYHADHPATISREEIGYL